MSFPSSVRDKALLAAARHCCVCRRYKGALLEVHHITPQSEGGADDLENAIALCFDCHAWAGHYFAKHPKGCKYSPDHLREAKKLWHAKVETGNVSLPTGELAFQARFLISRDADVSRSIFAGDLSVAPMENCMLANNEFGQFITKILTVHSSNPARFFGESYDSINAYRHAHPDAKCSCSDLDGYNYYDCIRNTSDQEFSSKISSISGFNKILLDMGAVSDDLCVVIAENGGCGDGSVSEEFLTRPPWVIFLALTNISTRPIALEEIAGLRELSEKYRPLGTANESWIISMPKCAISSNQTVLVPLSLLLGPIQELGEAQIDIKTLADRGEFKDVVNLTSLPEGGGSSLRIVGHSFVPKSLCFKSSESMEHQEIHALDISSVYTIDRVWQCGSCPHLFVLTDCGALEYAGELIAKGQGVLVSESIRLPVGTSRVLIAELEDEISFISKISLDDIIVLCDVELKKGDSIELNVEGVQTFSLTGSYFPLCSKLDFNHSGFARNKLICNFMASWQRDQTLNYLN